MASTSQSSSSSQQHETTTAYNRQEEYIAAQRAGAEAVLIGRETLETVVRQGEQLQNAENIANETEYSLDRATRLLKGMTWSGWLGNKFSRDVEPPEYKQTEQPKGVYSYENAPHSCMAAAQAVQNYNANLQVLETCETQEQKDTCKLICDNMYQQANKEVTAVLQQQQQDFPLRLQKDLKTLRVYQLKSETPSPRSTPPPTPNNAATTTTTNDKSRLFQGKSESSASSFAQPSPTDIVEGQQEEHLDFMSRHLEELGSLANNLNESMSRQSETLETLDGKSESMLFKSKMVTRRADRIIQKKSWIKTKAEFLQNVSIRHVKSGKYMSVSSANNNNSLLLSSKYNEMCIFGKWQRKGKSCLFGLQNKYSRRWAGQNLLGNLACSAKFFDRREEWDADDDWSETAILCTSAGWGNGGYLVVRPEDGVISIGGGGLQDKQIADVWCIQEHVVR